MYENWIKQHYPYSYLAKLQCAEATQSMVAEFPELRRVRGYIYIGVHQRPHWWCETKDGEIVDPTVQQYETVPVMYEEVPADAYEPHGKCLECGDLLFRHKGADSHLCENCKDSFKFVVWR